MRELTPEAAAALERHRNTPLVIEDEWKQKWRGDNETLADAMLDLFPPGHADPITPERLVACGFVACSVKPGVYRTGDLEHSVKTSWWWIVERGEDELIDHRLHPCNMGEVWELLDRLGIDWRTKGGV